MQSRTLLACSATLLLAACSTDVDDPSHPEVVAGDAYALVPYYPLVGVSSTCPVAALRWASTSDRVYIEGAGVVCSPRDVALSLASMKTRPAAGHGLFAVPGATATYYLGSSLYVQSGASLRVRGTTIGGDTNELRMRSQNAANGIVFIRAEFGTVELASTRVISWDDASNAPDQETDTYGRAYIDIRSYLEVDGVTPRESRMDITDSEVGYLGSHDAESYGLTWKVIGTPTTAGGGSLYDLVNVYGSIKHSELHHNYFGAYTFGAAGMVMDSNNVHHNVGYGLDPHDDSDALVITGNFVHDNGTHGIICSRRCDHLSIDGNISQRNGGAGIFLHGFVTDTFVTNNQSLDNGDAGFAIFDSHNNTLRNNVALRNLYGIRLSVGASGNLVENNEFGFSQKYGVYFYKGTDLPVTGDGRPKNNRILGNTFHDGDQGLKVTDADDNVIVGNTFTGFSNRSLLFRSGTGNHFEDNTNDNPEGPILQLEGAAGSPNATTMSKLPALKLKLVGPSTGVLAEVDGEIYGTEDDDVTTVSAAGSSQTFTHGNEALTLTEIRPLPLFVKLVSGASASVVPGHFDPYHWSVTAASAGVELSMRVGALSQGACYSVAKGGATLTSLAADADGEIELDDVPGSTSAVAYAVAPCL